MSLINIGDILLAFDVITDDQLKQALDYQKAWPKRKLGEIIIGHKFATEKQVAECLEKQRAIEQQESSLQDTTRLADYAASWLFENTPEIDTRGLTGMFDVRDFQQKKKG